MQQPNAEFEPDDAWKAELRERVQKDLDSLAQEAYLDRELGLKNAGSDLERNLVQEVFDDSIAHLRTIREEQIEAEIQREREERRMARLTGGGDGGGHSYTHSGSFQDSHRRGISYSQRHNPSYHSPRPSSHRPESRSSVDHKIWTPSISPEQDYLLEQQRRLGRPRANSTASRSNTPYQSFARSLAPNGRTVSASSSAKVASSTNGRSAPPPTQPPTRTRTASMSSSANNASFQVINEDEYDVFAFDDRRPSHVRQDGEGRTGEGTAPMRIPIVRPEARSASQMARRAATADIASGSPTAVSLASTTASASHPRSSSYLYVRTNTPHAQRTSDATDGSDPTDGGGSDPTDGGSGSEQGVTVESESLSDEEDDLKNARRKLEVARMKESVALGEFQRAMETYHAAKQTREAVEREVHSQEERRMSKMKRVYREILRMPKKGPSSGWGA
ncbi:hypothetical protein BD626DRAFT_507420 [Schizophyllum amplum]|uniref:Uncharacterized protein n=1 Tax=Schizophyllum amplum TaxID=97359 RepID=A0A550C401_9AGAR|nr:hypothetical protein BD626DRAFT_507420 [Auriculariopsis ampla]